MAIVSTSGIFGVTLASGLVHEMVMVEWKFQNSSVSGNLFLHET